MRWFLVRSRKDASKEAWFPLLDPQQITVRDVPGEQVFQVRLDPELVRRGVENLRKK